MTHATHNNDTSTLFAGQSRHPAASASARLHLNGLGSRDAGYWLSSVILFALQLIVVLILTPQLAATVGWLAALIPLFVFALFVGLVLRRRVAFLLAFIWSVVLIIHAFALILIQFHPIHIGYLMLMLLQSWLLSRVETVV